MAVVDMTKRLAARHVPKLVEHPSGSLVASGLRKVKVCALCGTVWPCATVKFLNNK